MAILSVQGLSLSFGGLKVLSDVDFQVEQGEIFAIIGPNGAGKTSILNCIGGFYRPDAGRIFFQDQDVTATSPDRRAALGLARTFQNIRLFDELSLLENVLAGFHGGLQSNFLAAVLRLPGYVRQEKAMYARALELLEMVGLKELAQERAGGLAYGRQRLLEIARALATGPRLLLLDEPAAGMNARETAALAELVRRLRDEMGVAILLIEHDMRFVMNLCERIMVLDQGRTIALGAPQEVQMNAAVIEAYLGAGIEMVQQGPRGEADHA